MNHLSNGPQKMKRHLLNVGSKIRRLRAKAENVLKNSNINSNQYEA